jgi:signal transduction histidine kinase
MESHARVLIADDEKMVRQRLRLMLTNRFHIEEAGSAQETLNGWEGRCDAILLDIVFPDGDGIDLCRRIKSQDPHVTVLVSSSLESVDAWDQAFQAGADGYMEKRELLGLDPRKITLTLTNLIERNRLRRKIEETSQRQSELLSILSHDVRAPFQALLGTIDLLRKGDIGAEAAEKVETLHECARDQLRFINSLLEYLRLESGNVVLRRVPVDVNLPVHQSVNGLSVLPQSKGVALEIDLSKSLPKIPGDLARIAQLVSNLVSNAVKFSPPGGRIKVRTQAQSQDGVPGVELVVEDNGIGIPEDLLPKLFQPFRRASACGTDGEKGSGLGLSICKEIVQLHGGTIVVEPIQPTGTLVRVWLPGEGQAALAQQRASA